MLLMPIRGQLQSPDGAAAGPTGPTGETGAPGHQGQRVPIDRARATGPTGATGRLARRVPGADRGDGRAWHRPYRSWHPPQCGALRRHGEQRAVWPGYPRCQRELVARECRTWHVCRAHPRRGKRHRALCRPSCRCGATVERGSGSDSGQGLAAPAHRGRHQSCAGGQGGDWDAGADWSRSKWWAMYGWIGWGLRRRLKAAMSST